MKKGYVKKSFVDGGMTDPETKLCPTFDGLIGTSKRWVSSSKNIGLPMKDKDYCKSQFQQLMKIQMQEGQVTSADMTPVGIPRGKLFCIGSNLLFLFL